jgi:putative (di)nucleoside polyphosphate hydrolase
MIGTEQQYRPCVGITLINDRGEIFIGERIDHAGAWQMPQGGIEPGETLEQAFFREMQEEIGTHNAKILDIFPETVRYDFPPGKRMKLYNGMYAGQEQTWIAAEFQGTDDEIDIHTFEPLEFRSWRWCTPLELLDIIVPFKRPTYERILGHFKRHLIK